MAKELAEMAYESFAQIMDWQVEFDEVNPEPNEMAEWKDLADHVKDMWRTVVNISILPDRKESGK